MNKIFIFNSSLRFNLVAKISGIPQIYQYPLFAKNKQHIIEAPKKFLKENLNQLEDILDAISTIDEVTKKTVSKVLTLL